MSRRTIALIVVSTLAAQHDEFVGQFSRDDRGDVPLSLVSTKPISCCFAGRRCGAINHEFGEVEETGILIKINEILEEKKKRHIETFLKEECLHPELIRKG